MIVLTYSASDIHTTAITIIAHVRDTRTRTELAMPQFESREEGSPGQLGGGLGRTVFQIFLSSAYVYVYKIYL